MPHVSNSTHQETLTVDPTVHTVLASGETTGGAQTSRGRMTIDLLGVAWARITEVGVGLVCVAHAAVSLSVMVCVSFW
ncbi:hypothetical protein TRAPUB_6716 [Trametes pubescens]|uniref:Uncharacterized protein n=1 Tax=Trametes pubescens TaxID=154538 RepID=A0A1M2V543_TRAPU|nr:hypothetical protein TRAPUB_6716 [Trametes pubescens]